MKKLIFIALVVFSSVAHAQALSAVLETGPAMDPTITNPAIANWEKHAQKYTISVFNDEKGSTIQIIKHENYFTPPTPPPANYTSSIISVHFDNLFLTDISITSDYAIVCGWTDSPSVVGIIGYFDIQSALTIFQIDLYWREVSSLHCINKVAAVLNTTDILVEAIGSNDPVAWTNHEISNSIVQCDDILTSTSTIRVANFQPNEWAYDIIVSNKYFVTVGYESTSQSLCLRRFGRTIGFLDPTINIQALLKTIVYSTPRATAIPTDDELAITFLDYNGLIGFSTNLLIVNIASAININYQVLPLNEKTPPDDIAYIEGDKLLVVLQQTPSGSYYNSSGFFFFDPQQTTNYISFADYFEEYIFHKIDNVKDVNHPDFIVISNDNRWAIRRETSIVTSPCPDQLSTQINVIPILPTLFNPDLLVPTPYWPPQQNPSKAISIKIPTNMCFSL